MKPNEMTAEQIKAELFDLQGHVCNGRLVVGSDRLEDEDQSRSCTGCIRYLVLMNELDHRRKLQFSAAQQSSQAGGGNG